MSKLTRAEFESWDSSKQRRYAERKYLEVRNDFLGLLKEHGLYRDHNRELITEVHHAWERAHCPLWYIFQIENFTGVGNGTHFEIHNKSKDLWREGTKIISNLASAIRAKLERENQKYKDSFVAGFDCTLPESS